MGIIFAFFVFFIGIYGLIARRNIIKSIIAFGIMQSALILFFISANYEVGALPPIFSEKLAGSHQLQANPLPQALMITAIVIGISITAVSLTMFISLYHHYGTTNWKKVVSRLKEENR